MRFKKVFCMALVAALSAITIAHAEVRFSGGILGMQPEENAKRYSQRLDFVWFPSLDPASHQLFASCRGVGTQSKKLKGTLNLSNINLRGFENETDIAGPDLKVKVKKGDGAGETAELVPLGPHANQTGVLVTADASWKGKIPGLLLIICDLSVVEFD